MTAQNIIPAQGLYGFRRNAPNPVQARFGEYPPGPIGVRPWRWGKEMTEGIKDGYLTQSMATEMVVPAGSIREEELGIVIKAARFAHMKTTVINPDGTVVTNPNTILARTIFQLRAGTGPIYTFLGSPSLGIIFYVDFSGGQSLSVYIDNTDPLTQLNGQTVQVQLFINADARFDIEKTRKGNPRT